MIEDDLWLVNCRLGATTQLVSGETAEIEMIDHESCSGSLVFFVYSLRMARALSRGIQCFINRNTFIMGTVESKLLSTWKFGFPAAQIHEIVEIRISRKLWRHLADFLKVDYC